MRLYQIDRVPPGFHYDEAAAALDAVDVLAGRHMVFSPRSYGREALFVYVAAPFVAMLGPTQLAVRLPTAIVGILTVLVTCLMGRKLFAKEDPSLAQWTGLLAALFLALSFWHVTLNRIGFRANYLPLVEVLCFFFLWRAVESRRVLDFALSGIFLGLSLHTYSASRLLPIVLVAAFAGFLLTPRGRVLVLSLKRYWVLLASVALLVFAPLLIYLLTNPEHLVPRAKALSIFSPYLHQGDFWGLLGRSVLGNLGLFGFRGDPNWVYNISGRPQVDAIQAILFWLGLGLCLIRWRRPRYLFLIVWWFVMLLPSILAPDPIPHSLRAIGTLPVACIISARFLSGLLLSIIRRLQPRWKRLSLAALVVVPLYAGWAGYNTWHSYFEEWSTREEVYYAYHSHIVDLAQTINRDDDPQAVYIFPVNYDRRGEIYSENTLEALHEGPVPFHYIVVDDATVGRDLTDICRGKRRVHLVVWTHGDHIDADPRQVLPFYLERFGQATDVVAHLGYRILTYELPNDAVGFDEPLDFVAAPAEFDDGLRLVAQAHGSTTSSGEAAWLALQWQVQDTPARDYKASVRLSDAAGNLVGQADDWLFSNEHSRTSQWEPGQVVTTYHLVPSLPATMPGNYQLHLLLYEPSTQHQSHLVSVDGTLSSQAVSLGSLQITRPRRRATLAPKVALEATELAPDLALLGYDLDRQSVNPGETMRVALYWRALSEIADDYSISLQMVDEQGRAVAMSQEEPVLATSQWHADDQWRDWRQLTVPPSTEPGEYQLTVHLAGSTAGHQTAVRLAQVQVEGRARLFEVPALDHPSLVMLGQAFQLLGYSLAEEHIRAGQDLNLTLVWQAQTESDISYTVFTHLIDAGSRIWGQKDSVPAQGEAPTTSWVVGEVIIDKYTIPVADDAPPGEYRIEVGMYEPSTGQRLAVFADTGQPVGDHILLDTAVLLDD
ncbi:MAG: glycosyltransferase family 39 protein [Anaerolineae bacterium]